MTGFTKSRTPEAIANELRFVRAMAGSGYTPALLGHTETSLTLDRITSEPVTDADGFLIHCCAMLTALRQRGIIHGDLTDRNLLVWDNRPYVIDFADSRFAGEPRPDKRPEGDAYWLWKAYEGLTADPRRHARRWLSIRDRLALHRCRTVLDLGCARGDMVLMAQAEGYEAAGLDRTPQEFIAPDIAVMDVLDGSFTADAMLLLSVLPYLLAQRGRAAAEAWLRGLECRALYVECQLAGDGPGPAAFATAADVAAFLAPFGTVTPLVSLPLPDRGAERTTFEVLR